RSGCGRGSTTPIEASDVPWIVVPSCRAVDEPGPGSAGPPWVNGNCTVNASDPAQVWGKALRCGPDAPLASSVRRRRGAEDRTDGGPHREGPGCLVRDRASCAPGRSPSELPYVRQ